MLSDVAYYADPGLIMEAAGKHPDPWQQTILRDRPSRLLLNCNRQSGKSTVVSAMAVDEVLRGEALVLAVCPSERQSKLLISVVRDLYECLGPKLYQPKTHTT